ncbi:Transthyretin-like family-containing protein [Aphelenchoides besseyi]|nr:Transthyretin-like family-containing protein [Aphelenchoides besseyi]KAI6218765.1 Transthyretin-like family-containing protein [Aphelenchoides besseyi]
MNFFFSIYTLPLLFVVTIQKSKALPSLGFVQSAAVRGKLICNQTAASNVLVKLWDNDRFDIDDLMDSAFTDADGTFELKGKETEITAIDPKLNIYHRCGDSKALCARKLSIFLPSEFVFKGPLPKRTFDLGTFSLDSIFEGEVRDCIH